MFQFTKTDTILKVENVSLTLGGNLILRNVNFEEQDITRPGMVQGQVISMLAPSGMGKTQILRILSGLYDQSMNDGTNFHLEGSVSIGHPLQPVKLGQVGLVQQDYPLFDHRTVSSNLSFVNKKYSASEGRDKANEYLNYFGLWDKHNLYPAQLSGGQRQRVAIIQQLLSSDHFILLDEPFSGLDINMIDKTCDTISKISCLDELNTVFIVTHDISTACAISDTVLLLGKEKNPEWTPAMEAAEIAAATAANRKPDLSGAWLQGATIRKTWDLMSAGLAWEKNIRDLPAFAELTRQVRREFKDLG